MDKITNTFLVLCQSLCSNSLVKTLYTTAGKSTHYIPKLSDKKTLNFVF